jgi:hypothetical protein
MNFKKNVSRKQIPSGRGRLLTAGATAALTLSVAALFGAAPSSAGGWLEQQSLDGRRNNVRHPGWGSAGSQYARTAPTWYADELGAIVNGPNSRYLGNRVANDVVRIDGVGGGGAADIFAETQVSQWGWLWAQFIDHNIAMRQGILASDPQGEVADILSSSGDPYEPPGGSKISFTRSATAPGTGSTGPREQINTISSYIDADSVYGGTTDRLEWLREGPVDGDMSNNGARLLLPDEYLPARDARGAPDDVPELDLGGRPVPDAVVAGDARVNNNAALTALETLIAREHNRIVGQLPAHLAEETKFQIARRVVIAEIQHITYQEFLPAMGIELPRYRGYDPTTNTTLSNEFATVGYRAHTLIHGLLSVTTNADRYTEEDLDALRAQGVLVGVSPDGKGVEMQVRIGTAQLNPGLVRMIQLGPLLEGMNEVPQYQNDELIDIELRNAACSPPTVQPLCVVDLAAIDLERGRDHGIASYNQLRQAYGLPPATSFTDITGEASESFPTDPELTPGAELDDFDSLDFTSVTNLFGSEVALTVGQPQDFAAVSYVRRTALAARLKALYGSVDKVDAIVGMLAEPRPSGKLFGQLQQAIWTRQFQQLRDGDRFFHGNQQTALDHIRRAYGIDFRRSLRDLVAANTDIPRADLPDHLFFVDGHVPPATCRISYQLDSQTGADSGTFTARLAITNTGRRPINGWIVRYHYSDAQQITGVENGLVAQANADVPITNTPERTTLGPGRTHTVRVDGTWTGRNTNPTSFSLNTTMCSSPEH